MRYAPIVIREVGIVGFSNHSWRTFSPDVERIAHWGLAVQSLRAELVEAAECSRDRAVVPAILKIPRPQAGTQT